MLYFVLPAVGLTLIAESLVRFSNVCNGCFKTIYTLAVQLAASRGIRHVVTGLSRGQIFETRLADLYRRGIYEPEEVDRTILEARAKESGKPAEIAAKMVEGGINKFLAEITLLGQPFVKDDKQTVEKMLAAQKAKVRGYRFLVVGEGIEKVVEDYAAEVAKAMQV